MIRLMLLLQELKEYRRAGIRTFADAELYEADKKRKSTVQPTLSAAAPSSLPKNWQNPSASAEFATPVSHKAPLHVMFMRLFILPIVLWQFCHKRN